MAHRDPLPVVVNGRNQPELRERGEGHSRHHPVPGRQRPIRTGMEGRKVAQSLPGDHMLEPGMNLRLR